MSVKCSVVVRNAMLDALESAIGTDAVLKLRSGAPPTNITDADSGTVIATLTLPSDWMQAAANGQKLKSAAAWQDASADNPGTVAHFRIYASNGTTQHLQGTVTSVATGTGDMLLDSDVVAAGQLISITAFTLTAGNP